MDRQIVYPGAIPLETDILNTNRSVLSSIGSLIGDTLGTSTQFTGLGCVPSIPAALTFVINPGVAYSLQNLDNTPYSSLPQDTAHQVMKQGIMQNAQTFSTPAPVTSGFSINYLLSAAFVEADINPVVLPYYNAANPAQAFSGPGGLGASNNTTRQDTTQLTLTTGVAAATGSQVTPATPAGTTALYVITVAFGQTTVTALNIAKVPGAPFFPGFVRVDGSTPFTGVQPGVAPALNNSGANLVTSAWVMGQVSGVVGSTANLSMLVSAASATGTITADEIVVETALGGSRYCLNNFSQVISTAAGTGVGKMDTGTAPASGFVAAYAIYNPATNTAAALLTNATSTVQPNVYGGANMPAGYTASALLFVVPTTAASLIDICNVRGRKTSITLKSMFSTATVSAGASIVNNLAVPVNAKVCSGVLQIGNTATSSVSMTIYGSTGATGGKTLASTLNGSSVAVPFDALEITVAQRAFYSAASSSGTPSFAASVSSWEV